ncbi:alpha/beta-hydrolase [Annulohypoxylon truncatum]|uniref:alpha/beta-hydrolase n=1 Tax=Annulohypoxylon truncatum TaxID=327061 RepID=UPI002008C25F|nr:alpha/beta-hydrolase [Annulohypoxylon truncatum]KAI1213938.1 alpha/beta-hydrolase [Annulohypoxylon truncatum]
MAEEEQLPDPPKGRREIAMNKLRAVKRRIKPWYIYALIATTIVTLVVVLSAVLVTRRNHQWFIEKVQHDKATPSNPGNARVNLGYAQYQGTLVGSGGGVAQYLGMRFAAPPTGDRRWKAPVEPEVEDSGDQAADSFGPICLGLGSSYPNSDEDEDCLYANVWAPVNATVDSKLPVWLFIQGGGYNTNSNANWNGTYLLEQSNNSIVFVNFNYRVGLWGFLASERLLAPGADGDLNVGLRDQIAMLRWTRQHIAQFGGDPDHVVITGTSAGAGSVALHLVMAYGAHGQGSYGSYGSYGNATSGDNSDVGDSVGTNLFVGGVGESVFFPWQPVLADLEWQYDLLLNQTGCDALSCLRGLSTETLQALNTASPFPGRPGLPAPLPLFYWTPCVDGALLRDLPYVLFDRGEYVPVPVIMGTTTNEGASFATNASTPDEFGTFMQDNYPHLTSNQTADIVAEYPQALQAPLPAHASWFPSTAAAYGEATFICPADYILASYARPPVPPFNAGVNASRIWGYRYDVADPMNTAEGLGVPHIWESWAVYGPDAINGVGGGPASYYYPGIAAGVVKPVQDYWISFVKNLDPNTGRAAGAPVWEAWGTTNETNSANNANNTSDGGQRLLFQTEGFSMEPVASDLQDRCDFWRKLVPATQQ